MDLTGAETVVSSSRLSKLTVPMLRSIQAYGNLFFLLQAEPRHIASLCRLISMAEIDILLQTVMFTLYGNQYESREEHLLLTMFQVSARSCPTHLGDIVGLVADGRLLACVAVCAVSPV